MSKRFISIWFPQLTTDWFTRHWPGLHTMPFALSAPDHGRMMITAANKLAQQQGATTGMVVADARAIIPSLQVFDDKPDLPGKLLNQLAEYCIRFTPFVAIDGGDGLILDVTGCSHLWGGDDLYITAISKRLKTFGYTNRIAVADTIGVAWAVARFAKESFVIKSGQNTDAILTLPPSALRLETDTVERLNKLGLRQIKDFIFMPRTVLRRRFGQHFITRLNQALGNEEEIVQPVLPVEPWQERLPCLEPIVTLTGIEIALQRLLDTLCNQLKQKEKGLRLACFKCYRADGKIMKIEIGTNRPSNNVIHLFKLFEIKLSSIEPAEGIELFILEAPKVEDHSPVQEQLWENIGGLDNNGLSELLDRLAGKMGDGLIHRYLPDEHYLPERSIKEATTLQEKLSTTWKVDRPRPLQLLSIPERIEVTAPVPDYPPMLFRYKGKLHKIIKADGPERIEQEWWLHEGRHRDYYYAEDDNGYRYWLFRSGHYDSGKSYAWFIHGFFA